MWWWPFFFFARLSWLSCVLFRLFTNFKSSEMMIMRQWVGAVTHVRHQSLGIWMCELKMWIQFEAIAAIFSLPLSCLQFGVAFGARQSASDVLKSIQKIEWQYFNIKCIPIEHTILSHVSSARTANTFSQPNRYVLNVLRTSFHLFQYNGRTHSTEVSIVTDIWNALVDCCRRHSIVVAVVKIDFSGKQYHNIRKKEKKNTCAWI